MGKNVEFELDKPGLTAFFKSGPVMAMLNDIAHQIAASAGDGYVVESAHPITWVAVAGVYASSAKAKKENLTNDTLLKAKGSVKL